MKTKFEFKPGRHDIKYWMLANGYHCMPKVSKMSDGISPAIFAIMNQYLQSLGFDQNHHYVESNDFRIMKGNFEFAISRLPHFGARKLSDCLTKSFNGYWLRGETGKYSINPELKRMLNDSAGLVYPLEPHHFYFEVSNGYLSIKYQHIIGSRILCKIVNE